MGAADVATGRHHARCGAGSRQQTRRVERTLAYRWPTSRLPTDGEDPSRLAGSNEPERADDGDAGGFEHGSVARASAWLVTVLGTGGLLMQEYPTGSTVYLGPKDSVTARAVLNDVRQRGLPIAMPPRVWRQGSED